jgi:hypothetical protein
MCSDENSARKLLSISVLMLYIGVRLVKVKYSGTSN